ncbi:MAG: P-loop containing nucleoside triphosphate hydrolase protein [Linnemannia elongata]|nr:MAG: P-loop containing nucleoside triphosphate hydrolase protein [Linnemannia elongata]
MAIKNNFLPTGPYSLILVGNPGVGKSAILNALGGDSDSGYSEITGRTREVSEQLVPFNHFQLRLFDTPGIDDRSPDGRGSIVKHLNMLENALSREGLFIILFVIKPTNGWIMTRDYVIMKTVLESLKKGPQIGLILTQARTIDMHQNRSPTYTRSVLRPREKIVDKRSKKFLSRVPPLVLADHDERGFTAEEKSDLLSFVLSFDPKPVDSRNMIEHIMRLYFDEIAMNI